MWGHMTDTGMSHSLISSRKKMPKWFKVGSSQKRTLIPSSLCCTSVNSTSEVPDATKRHTYGNSVTAPTASPGAKAGGAWVWLPHVLPRALREHCASAARELREQTRPHQPILPACCSFFALGHFLTGGERNGGYATFMWHERAQTRATQMTQIPSLKPLCLLYQNQGSSRHRRVIRLPQRKNVHPI